MDERADQESRLVRLSEAELILLNNALNEVLHGVEIEEWEFSTRLGATRFEAERLLEKVQRVLDQLSTEPRDEPDSEGM